jgi:hypothetical protein
MYPLNKNEKVHFSPALFMRTVGSINNFSFYFSTHWGGFYLG